MAITDILGTATATAGLIVSSRATDVVAITGSDYVQVFADARPLAASVRETASLMEHPLETGSVIADHIVFGPVEIDLPLVVTGSAVYRSTYAAIRTAYRAGTLFVVRTRTGSYPNMVITEMPHDESGGVYDAITIRVRLREARFVTPETELVAAQVANPAQASTTDRGNVQTTTTTPATETQATSTVEASGAGPEPSGSQLYQWAYAS